MAEDHKEKQLSAIFTFKQNISNSKRKSSFIESVCSCAVPL